MGEKPGASDAGIAVSDPGVPSRVASDDPGAKLASPTGAGAGQGYEAAASGNGDPDPASTTVKSSKSNSQD